MNPRDKNTAKLKNPEDVVLNNGILSSMSIGKVFKDFVDFYN
jgi:hypothetical protein